MMNSSDIRRLKVALLVGLAVVPVVVAAFLLSTDRQLALQVLAGPELRELAGEVQFSFPISVKIHFGDERYSRITYIVLGTRKRGFLKVAMEGVATGLVVKSATFDGSPLGVSKDTRRIEGGS
jgi:hypothetical protein